MSRIEILNSGSLRIDGRRPHELRSAALHINPPHFASSHTQQTLAGPSSISAGSTTKGADGSARVEQGLTVVHAAVFGPREARSRSSTHHDRAVVQVDVSLEPWSGRERRKRARGDRRIAEISANIEATFEPVIQTHLYPRSTIDIFISVENQDGGVLPCAINAVTLALLDAGISMTDYVVAMSVGLHLQSGQTLLDLSSHEENALPHLVAATLPQSGKITLVQLETRIHTNAVREMLSIVKQACSVLHEEMDAASQERTRRLAVAMGGEHGVSMSQDHELDDLEEHDIHFADETMQKD